MIDFTHFTDYAEFGYVKVANKQLKRLNELKNTSTGSQGLGNSTTTTSKNKLLDELYESRNAKDLINQQNYVDSEYFGEYSGKGTRHRGRNRKNARNYGQPLLDGSIMPQVLRKPKSSEDYRSPPKRIKEVVPDTQGFTDIRKTDDAAASESGYLGFRKDPHKGYGGMMEEPVDMLPTGRISSKARIPY